MKKILGLLTFATLSVCTSLLAQDVLLEGYVYETDNRGYLNRATIVFIDKRTELVVDTVFSNTEGYFKTTLPRNRTYTLHADKHHFFPTTQDLSSYIENDKNKIFVKVKLEREPGYTFDVTLARFREHEDSVVDAVEGAWIEIYNNTTREEELNLKNYPDPNFYFTFQQGHHYTIMIRKEGYFTKRLEAYVNVDGCILCFEGIGNIHNVTDNLTEGNEMGVILANIELDPADLGSKYRIENIYYDYDKWNIRPDAAIELDKLVQVLQDNPTIIVELGSHTDSRGRDEYNEELSSKRANSAVEYLIKHGVQRHRILSRGYGESDLINHCKNGVPCNGREHQENRRTEIKVVGFLSDDPLANKSLAQIKVEENMGDILKELEDEVVEFGTGEDISEEILQEIVQQTGDSTLLYMNNDDQEIDQPIAREAESSVDRREQSDLLESKSTPSENTGNTRPGWPAFMPLPDDFDGYSVWLTSSRDEESLNALRFQRFPKIFGRQLDDETIGFFVGQFQTDYSAQNMLKLVQKDFPKARVVYFEEGRMND